MSLLLPQEVILEVTNRCNLRCRYCHIHGAEAEFHRRQGSMAPALWRKIVEELASWGKPVTLVTHGAGEPLLYPHLKELLKTAKEVEHLTVGFMTNAMLLNKEMAQFLVEIGLDWIAFSVDGVTPPLHDSIRIGADLSKIEGNILYLHRIKMENGLLRPRFRFNMVLYPHIDPGERHRYLEKWLPMADVISLSRFRPVGSRRLSLPPDIVRAPCRNLLSQMVIAWDGRLGLCCEDIEATVSPGSAADADLATLFSGSEVYIRYREAHGRGEAEGLPLCSDCDIWASHIVLDSGVVSVGGVEARWTRTPAYELYSRVEG